MAQTIVNLIISEIKNSVKVENVSMIIIDERCIFTYGVANIDIVVSAEKDLVEIRTFGEEYQTAEIEIVRA